MNPIRNASRRRAADVPSGIVPETLVDLPPLSAEQTRFARAYVELGANVERAVAVSAIDGKDPVGKARAWLRRPELMFAIKEELKRAALTAGPVALATLREIAIDVTMPATARVAAAKHLLDVWRSPDLGGSPATDASSGDIAADGPIGVYGPETMHHIRRLLVLEERTTVARGSAPPVDILQGLADPAPPTSTSAAKRPLTIDQAPE